MNLRLPALLLGAGLFLGLAGCRSTNPAGTSSLSAVVITNQSEELIRTATLEVFAADHYQLKTVKGNLLVFEKRGSSMDTLVWGGWQDGEVWTRVKVQIKPYARSDYVVECDAFRIRGRGDSVFEEEQRVYKAAPYRRMLDQIVAKLR